MLILAYGQGDPVLLRITKTERDAEIWLKLEGKLMGPWVGECRMACAQTASQARPTRLDLSGITYVDFEGENLLRRLLAEGFEIPFSSTFVAELLREERSP